VYAKSKFQAEKCVQEAIREGVPATVYRVGNLVGHSQTGQFQINMDSNAFYRMTKAMILVEAGAEDAGAVDLTPVDYGARALVRLVNHKDAAGQTYHLCNPRQLSSREWMEYVRAFGYELKGMSWADYETWLLHEGATGRYQEALQLLIAQLEEVSQTQTVIHYDCAETVRVLEALEIRCPAPDLDLVFAMLGYAVKTGYFPQSFVTR
jgi:thioester reductase-like protein